MISRNNRLRKMRTRHLTIDLSELIDFQEKLQRLSESGMREFLKKQIQEVADSLYEKARAKTKPHNKTGNLYNSWRITKVIDRGDHYEVRVYNNARNSKGQCYASFVELGHRTRNRQNWVNGYFMLYKSVLEVESEMKTVIERELTKFLEEKLDVK